MKIKLLHTVLHDGHRVEAGEIGDIDPEIAAPLIASGAAVAVEEAGSAPVAPPALTMMPAWRGEICAPPIRKPLSPASSMIRPTGGAPSGRRNTLPALGKS